MKKRFALLLVPVALFIAACDGNGPQVNHIHLPNGKTVTCVKASDSRRSGIDCDWAHAR